MDAWEERARAAEKTVEVLKARVKLLYDGSQTTMQRQLERARHREERNRQRRDLMEMRTLELARYSLQLEAEVRRRTVAMRTILDNVTFGFLLIDRELTVQEGHTRSCEALFDATQVAGRHLADLLHADVRTRGAMAVGAEQIFDDVLPEDMLVAQMPQRFVLPDDRVLHMDARIVRGQTGEVGGVLLTISDITALEHAQREGQENGLLLGLLRQREAFGAFVADVKEQLFAARSAVDVGSQSECRRVLHTIKGNCGCFGLADVAALVHAIEEDPTITSDSVGRIEASLRGFLLRHRGVLQLDYDHARDETFHVNDVQLTKLNELARSFGPTEAMAVEQWIGAVVRRPASVMLGPIAGFVERVSERLGKEVDFAMEGNDLLVDAHRTRQVFQNVTHLLRNALDHGIEEPSGRGEKSPRGSLRLSVRETATDYVVSVQDDGRGIDLQALERKAVQVGVVNAAKLHELTDAERLRLVFLEGLSTAAAASELSGRGVGMSAVEAAARGVGGRVAVSTRQGLGTTIDVIIPREEPNATSSRTLRTSSGGHLVPASPRSSAPPG